MADDLQRLTTALTDRYRIERELGRGGMARVYLAQDVRHRRKVAIKVLRPDLAAMVGSDRFLREIETAARLTHPHIVPLHDSGNADGLLYYVMPYIEGESLRARLERQRELPVADAVRVLRDVADALAYAHERGVVHRDIKPDNVMLTGRHAVVMDFGVATAVSEAAANPRLTATGVALGTPAYMAPEQAAAEPGLDARADIYALGVVAYEVLAGRPPFTGRTAAELMAAHIAQQPQPLTERGATIPEGLARVVMKCLAKVPTDRWQSADELLVQLDAFLTPGAGVVPVVRGIRRRRMLALGAVVLAAGLAGAAMVWRGGSSFPANRIVVAPFEDRTGAADMAGLGDLATDWITRTLSRSEILDVAPAAFGRDAEQVPTRNARERWRELARQAGAAIIVTGSYTRADGQVRFQSEVLNARTGRLVAAVEPASGPADSATHVIGRLADRIAGAITLQLDPGRRIVGHISNPPNLIAYRLYQEGIAHFRRIENEPALALFEQASAFDSTFAPPRLLMASLHRSAGRGTVADSILRWLRTRQGGLTASERQWMEYLIASQRGDREAAFRHADALFRMSPPDSPWPLISALEGLRTNRLRLAAARFRTVSTEGPQAADWPWPGHAHVLHLLGDHRRELEVARDWQRRVSQSSAAAFAEVRALAALGRTEEAVAALARTVALASSELTGSAFPFAAIATALELRAHDHADAAQAVLDDAVRQLRDGRVTVGHLTRAVLLYRGGYWPEALAVLDSLRAAQPNAMPIHVLTGVTLARLGRRDEALAADSQLAVLPTPPSTASTLGSRPYARARIAAVLGDRDRAVRLLREAFAEGMLHGISIHEENDFESLRDYPAFVALMRPRD